MSRLHRRNRIIGCAIALLIWTDLAQAQGIMLARRVIGGIEQMYSIRRATASSWVTLNVECSRGS